MPGYINKLPTFFYYGALVALVSNITTLVHQSFFVKLVGDLTFVLPFLGFAILWRINNDNPLLFDGKRSLFQIDNIIWSKLSKYFMLHIFLIILIGYFVHGFKSVDQFISSGSFFSFYGFWGSVNCYYVFKSLIGRIANES